MVRVEKIVQPSSGSHIWFELMEKKNKPEEKQSQKTGCIILLLNIAHIDPYFSENFTDMWDCLQELHI